VTATATTEAPSGIATLIRVPYVGLTFFTEADSAVFFGRDEERRLIATTLLASRFTVVYGESGVGKSSLLRAGVAHDLRELALRELAQARSDNGNRPPSHIALVFSDWQGDPVPKLDEAIAETAQSYGLKTRPSRATTFYELVKRWADALDTTIVIVLDQFEEYLLYHPSAADDVGIGLAQAIANPDLSVRFALGIREDALAKLDRFEDLIPNLFDNYLRVDHLDEAAGEAAIRGPIDRYNKALAPGRGPVELDDSLVPVVLDQVRTDAIGAGSTGRGSATKETGTSIEAPFLQLVMERLWQEDSPTGRLSKATFDRLGGAEKIVLSYLDDSMKALPARDQEAAAAIFRDLVTPSGQKIAQTPTDLAELAGYDEDRVRQMLELLAARRIVRPVAPAADSTDARYEIFHDKLADPILDWRARHVQAEQEAEARDRLRTEVRRRIRRLLLSAAVAALLLLAAGLVFSTVSANRAAPVLKSRELAAESLAILPANPERSVALAAEALRRADTRQADEALRSALAASRLRGVIRLKMNPDRVAFADHGRYAVTSDKHGRVVAWKPGSARAPLVIEGDPGFYPGISPASRKIVVEHQQVNEIWDLASGKMVESVPQGPGTGQDPVLSADGGRVAVIRKNTVTIWQLSPKRMLAVADAGAPVQSVALTAEGDRFALGTTTGSVQFWQVGRGRRFTSSWGDAPIWKVSLSPDAHRLLVSGVAPRARVYNLQLGTELASLRIGGSRADASDFSPDGSHVLTETGSVVTVWDTKTWQPVAIHRDSDAVMNAVFSPDGAYVLTPNRNAVASIWSTTSGRTLLDLVGHSSAVNDAAFTPDGSVVVTVSSDQTARVWKVSDAQSLVGPGTDHFNAAAFSPDGAMIATAGDDARVRLWNARTLEFERALPRYDTEPISGLAFSTNGPKRIVTASWDDKARIWDLDTGRQIALKGHTDDVIQAHFSPDGRRVVTASLDQTAAVWDAESGKRLLRLRKHHGYVTDAVFDATGERIATASWDGTAKIWNARTGELITTLQGHRGGLNVVRFSPGGDLIATAGLDKTAVLWDARDGSRKRILIGHTAPIWDIAFDKSGTRVLTAGADATVRVWDVATGRLVTILPRGTSSVNAAQFDPTNSLRILTATDDGAAQVGLCGTCGDHAELLRLADTQARVLRQAGG
jgi:WD40 repeat protein